MQQPDSGASLNGARQWIALVAALTVGMALLAGFAFFDKQHRTAKESATTAPTAAGDASFFALPAPLETDKPLLLWNGVSYFAAETQLEEHTDGEMVQVGTADTMPAAIYRRLLKEVPSAETRVAYYVKTGPGEFIRLR